jgi:hypothetical protein
MKTGGGVETAAAAKVAAAVAAAAAAGCRWQRWIPQKGASGSGGGRIGLGERYLVVVVVDQKVEAGRLAMTMAMTMTTEVDGGKSDEEVREMKRNSRGR